MGEFTLSIADIIGQFPTYRVALVVAEGLAIVPERPPELERYVHEAQAGAARDFAGRELGDIPEVRAWRLAYKAFGVKGTSHRSSVERLVKRAARGDSLPRVNALVDAYNAVSLRYLMPAGADDLDRVAPPLAFRHAIPGDSFISLDDATPDPPEPGEVVYADAAKVLCRRWNWKQDARSAIGPETRRAALTVQAIAPESAAHLEEAASELRALLTACCGARCAWAVADHASPIVSVSVP